MRINDIEQFFKGNVPKKTLTELSLDSNNNISLINSDNQSFDFDNIDTPIIQRDKIKTSDTIYFKNGKVIFIEFKRGQRIPETDFRLKAMESIVTFYNYVFNQNFTDNICFPNDLFQIYFIYNKDNISATALPYFRNLERKFRTQFKHFISEYHIIESDEFIRLFNT
ncbi:hypothetical protein DMB65_08835 [Flavobacterium cheongpyeongense]|uniref:Uncharacterized protein n=1 Tax=Flavobacterium cheongpyeongense TaxID=2212651 RepID=A0A2V4BQ60_9FLAO|nr:hypothetical protein [Flavobacterium cheongpyeongense]PXY41055.1 hypothetical protein DMB65_08835 [Flavobacterium cheongpyeongense]